MKNLERKISAVTQLTILLAFCALWTASAAAQQNTTEPQQTATAQPVVPHLVRIAATAKDVNGSLLTGVVGVTFAMYAEQNGGAPLWLEMQNVQADNNGHYTVLLGATKPAGLPVDLFTSGEARWLGTQLEGQPEQPRMVLVAVPYALKAGDAETIGGLPASAFVLANGVQGDRPSQQTMSAAAAPSSAAKSTAPPANPAVTGKGIVDYIPMWDTTGDIVDSVMFQKSSEIGVGTTLPAALLDVNGKTDVRDTLTLFPHSTDSTLAVSGTTFKIDQTGKVTFITGQTFTGAGTITGITTASGSGLSGGGTSGTLSLKVPSAGITNAMLAHSSLTLIAGGGMTGGGLASLGGSTTLGLKTCGANQVLEYISSVWTCSSAGTGTITGVTAGTDLTGGGTSGSVTLNLDPTKVPQLIGGNTFSGTQFVEGSVSATNGIGSVVSNSQVAMTGDNFTPPGGSVLATYGVEGLLSNGTYAGAGLFGYINQISGEGVFDAHLRDAFFEFGLVDHQTALHVPVEAADGCGGDHTFGRAA